MNTFKIIPILGRKTNVPADDPSMFRFISQGLALTHDAGGLNFDLDRKRNACSKSYGLSRWGNTKMTIPQDNSTYTEDDVPTRIALTDSTTVTVTDLDNDEQVQLYKDFGAGYFSGDFEHHLRTQYTSDTDSGDVCGVWALTNDLTGGIVSLYAASKDFLTLYWSHLSGTDKLVLAELNSGSFSSDESTDLDASTNYYIKIVRYESVGTYGTLYCYIYSDDSFSTLVDTLSVALTEKQDFRYHFWVLGNEDGGEGGTVWSGVIADHSISSPDTNCLGMFELYDGTNRNHLVCQNGLVYAYDSALNPIKISGAVTFATDITDLYSIIKVGEYAVIADMAEHTPYKWKSGDAIVSKLCASGTEYKFRYLENFQRRVIGAYSDQTNGNIDVRWSTSWPGTAITSLNFPAANQLYVPNDDPIVGIAAMGSDRCFIYCENSIQQMFYYPDYESPFRVITGIPKQGFTNHHSIVNLGDRHFGFNRNYGFCEFRGNQFPVNGRPISDDIDLDLWDINSNYYSLIVGTEVPLTDQIVWAVPTGGEAYCNKLYFYNYITGQWTIEDKICGFVDNWQLYSNYTWNDLLSDIGGSTSVWTALGTTTLAYYTKLRERLVMANTDGDVYQRTGEADAGDDLDGYRVEPILHFGDPNRYDIINEIWFDICSSGSFSVDVCHRSGNTAGEVLGQTWTSIGSVSCDSPSRAVITGFSKPARMHQIKWGTNAANESFQVNGITFKFTMDSTA